MNKSAFIRKLDHAALEEAIGRAELLTSGEIRVAVTHRRTDDPVTAARQLFLKLGMTRTRDRNAILIFVAPASQTFAVIGDEGVHQKCGDAFWRELTAAMTGHFAADDFQAGLLHGIARTGELLADHFPRRSDDRNELPDKVIEG